MAVASEISIPKVEAAAGCQKEEWSLTRGATCCASAPTACATERLNCSSAPMM
jgi:hypothetical protein